MTPGVSPIRAVRTLVVLLVLLSVSGCGGGGGGTGGSGTAATPADFDFGSNDPHRATAFGDSITFGVLELKRVRSDLVTRNNYPNQLQGMLRGLDAAWRVVNRGSPGELSGSGSRRLPSVLASDRSGYVLLMEGTNDATQGVDAGVIVGNLEAMVLAAQGNRTIPILATIPPDFRNDPGARDTIEAANAQIRSLGSRHGIVIADMFNGMNDRALWGLGPNRDPLHPNEQGYGVMASIWLDAMQRAAPGRRLEAAQRPRR